MIVVVASMDRETAALRRSARFPRGADASSSPVRFYVMGVGKEKVERFLTSLPSDSTALRCILSLGFAGALRDDLRTGDLVFAGRVHAVGEEGSFEVDPALLELAQDVAGELGTVRCFTADTLTVPMVASSPAEKHLLAASVSAAIANMEDYWVARWSAQHGVPFLSARAVLDTAGQEVPAFVSGLAGKTLLTQALGVAVHGLGRPEKLLSVARLVRQDRLARRSLAAFGSRFISRASEKVSYAGI